MKKKYPISEILDNAETKDELLSYLIIDMLDFPGDYESFAISDIKMYEGTYSLKSIKLHATDKVKD